MQNPNLVIGKFDWLKPQGRPPEGNRRFAIMRVKKISGKGGTGRANLSAAIAHNLRERNTPNADADRLNDNTILKGPDNGQDFLAAWDDRAPEKIRVNAVHALEYVVTASPEKMRAMPREEQDAYFNRALAWFEDKHGAANVLSAVVHRDEITPHLQLLVIPLDERGKLNARELVGGKATLSQMQTDFAQNVGAEFGLDRGLKRSQARHQTIKEYYARASTPVEADFSAPERHKGNLLGVGKESDDEWRQRASEAANEHIKHSQVANETENARLHQNIAQLRAENAMLRDALRCELGPLSEEEAQTYAATIKGTGYILEHRELAPFETKDLYKAAERFLGHQGMNDLCQGDLTVLPGANMEHKRCLAMTILTVDAKVTGENHQRQIDAWAREGLPQEHQQILSKIERTLDPAEREELEAGRVTEAFARHKFDPKQQLDLAAHYLTVRMALGADLSASLESVSEQQDQFRKTQEAAERRKALQEAQKTRPRERDDGWDL